MRALRSILALVAPISLLLAGPVAGQTPREPLALWYPRAAEQWVEALPVGNGRLGAMVFGGPAQDRIQFNESTIWTGGPHDYARKGARRYLDTLR